MYRRISLLLENNYTRWCTSELAHTWFGNPREYRTGCFELCNCSTRHLKSSNLTLVLTLDLCKYGYMQSQIGKAISEIKCPI